MVYQNTYNGGVRKFTVDELTYKELRHCNDNMYYVDAYYGNTLLMTYKAYYDYKRDEFKLYPFTPHRVDPRIPGYHTVPNRSMRR